jgi:hypothetical protein
MTRVRAQRDVPGSVADAEAVWYEPVRWPSWVEGFGHVVAVEGDWPRAGASVTWQSRPGGRGHVTERVLSFEPGAGQEVEVADDSLSGRQSVRFEPLADGVSVSVVLDYRLTRRLPVGALVDRLFIRRALADSLRRTLERFAAEVADR